MRVAQRIGKLVLAACHESAPDDLPCRQKFDRFGKARLALAVRTAASGDGNSSICASRPKERKPGEQFGYASSFDIHVAASSGEEKDVGREGVKKAAVALRMAKFLINVDEIFDDERLAGTDKVRHIREKSRTPEKRLTTRW